MEKKNADLIRLLNRKEDDNKSLKSRCTKLQATIDREEESKKLLEKKCNRLKSDLYKEDEYNKSLERQCSVLKAELERKEGKTSLDWSASVEFDDTKEHVIRLEENHPNQEDQPVEKDTFQESQKQTGDAERSNIVKLQFELEETKKIRDKQVEQINALHEDNQRLLLEREEIKQSYEMLLVDFQSYQIHCNDSMKNLQNEVTNDLNIMINNIMVNNMATIEGHCEEYEQV